MLGCFLATQAVCVHMCNDFSNWIKLYVYVQCVYMFTYIINLLVLDLLILDLLGSLSLFLCVISRHYPNALD